MFRVGMDTSYLIYYPQVSAFYKCKQNPLFSIPYRVVLMCHDVKRCMDDSIIDGTIHKRPPSPQNYPLI